MKKEYVKPTMKVYDMGPVNIMAGSGGKKHPHAGGLKPGNGTGNGKWEVAGSENSSDVNNAGGTNNIDPAFWNGFNP